MLGGQLYCGEVDGLSIGVIVLGTSQAPHITKDLETNTMKNWPFGIGFVVIGVIIAIVYWQLYRPEQQAPTQVVAPPPISTPADSAIQHPITTVPEELKAAEPVIDLEQPLPELKQSDMPMAEILAKLFTDQKLHDVGLGKNIDKDKKFDTPSLVEVWRTAPYLYDGRAVTMQQVLTEFNKNDMHGMTSKLSGEQIDDLAEFVLSQ